MFIPRIFKMFRNSLGIIKKNQPISILWETRNAKDKFPYSINNDNKRIIFGLISLLETGNCQQQTKKASGRRRLMKLSVLVLAGGVTLGYAKYDSDLRILLRYVPFISISTKEEKNSGIKDSFVNFIYRHKSNTSKIIKPEVYDKGFRMDLKNYISSMGSLPKTIKESAENVLSFAYNSTKNPIVKLFSGNKLEWKAVEKVVQPKQYQGIMGNWWFKSKPEEEQVPQSSKYRNFSKALKDYALSMGSLPKTIMESAGNVLSFAYNATKNPIVKLFSRNKLELEAVEKVDQPKQYQGIMGNWWFKSKPEVEQVLESSKYRNFSKAFKDYVRSVGSLPKTMKESAGNVLYFMYNSIKNPAVKIFSGNKSEVIKEDVQPKEYQDSVKNHIQMNQNVFAGTYNYTKSTVTSWFKSKPEVDRSVEQVSESSKYRRIASIKVWLTEEIQKIESIQRCINTNISNEEKLQLLVEWIGEINNIYKMMTTFNTSSSSIILSQYSKYSKSLNNLITNLSKNEDYARVVTILAFITVVTVQLYLFAFLNVPFTDQLCNLAFSVYSNMDGLKNDPRLQETLGIIIKKINGYFPKDMLLSVDWAYYINMLWMYFKYYKMAYSLFTSVAYGKDK